ncbi:universal stress protein [Actinoplanes solisilvae]|uniref:universal stress protein n=1 Tax=Actinoplanes solisilvae TaxID=2486853 RepID=UPI000FD712BE|nr:universal stress protein [Actinoplanes solisilvae]
MARVVVGIDGSEQALVAVRAGAVEAARRHLPLRIVHAFVWPLLHVKVGPVADDMPGTGLEHHAEELLGEAAAVAREVAPALEITTDLVDGAATPVIIEASRNATLLVLGDRGLGSISGLIVGSVAVHATAHAHCPVLIVRGAVTPSGPIVVGVDGSESSELAVAFAYEEAARRAAPLNAVIAWHEADPAGAHEWRSAEYSAEIFENEARRVLSESLAGWREKFPEVEVNPEAVRGHPRQVLVERSKTAQLVVAGARGRDTFKGLLLGSVSQSLVYHAGCPVAVVRGTTL